MPALALTSLASGGYVETPIAITLNSLDVMTDMNTVSARENRPAVHAAWAVLVLGRCLLGRDQWDDGFRPPGNQAGSGLSVDEKNAEQIASEWSGSLTTPMAVGSRGDGHVSRPLAAARSLCSPIRISE